MINLTERQAKIMQYIRAFKKRAGVAPSYREIAAYMGITVSGVRKHLELIEKKGQIEVTPYRARGIEIKEEKK
ncbi:MAG: HTH domain-containing protein [Fibrobacter sp.]|nr:HTH domain-containing protein [Fibrobacter sp.]